MTAKKPPAYLDFKKQQEKLFGKLDPKAELTKQRRAWPALPDSFRRLLGKNGEVSRDSVDGPISAIPKPELLRLRAAAERLLDYCERASVILTAELGARE